MLSESYLLSYIINFKFALYIKFGVSKLRLP